MKQSRSLSVLLSLLTALLVLSGSIAVPILCRPFYYAHVDALDLAGYTGLTKEQIYQSYGAVLDYCIGKTETFSAGPLPFSQSGADHFADVRGLFLLDLRVLALSLAGLILVLALCQWRRTRPCRFLGRGPGLWAACGLGAGFLVLGGLAALDFDRAFVVFHHLFFPGKDNWLFDWRTDPVILILPQEYFRDCAILALCLLLVWCGVLIAFDVFRRKKRPAV